MPKKSSKSETIDLTADPVVEADASEGRKRKKKAAEIEAPEIVKSYSTRRRQSVFVNLVRTKNAESMSFKTFSADSDKALREMVSDMTTGWNGMNQVVGDQSHTYLIYIDDLTIKVVDHEFTSVKAIEDLLDDASWKNCARTILDLVPAKFPGRTIVVEVPDKEIKKVKEYKAAVRAGEGSCKIYRDIWALNNLGVDIS